MHSRHLKSTRLFFNHCKESWNPKTHWNSAAAAAFIWRESNCSDSSWVECNVGGDYMGASFSLFTVLSTEAGIHWTMSFMSNVPPWEQTWLSKDRQDYDSTCVSRLCSVCTKRQYYITEGIQTPTLELHPIQFYLMIWEMYTTVMFI